MFFMILKTKYTEETNYTEDTNYTKYTTYTVKIKIQNVQNSTLPIIFYLSWVFLRGSWMFLPTNRKQNGRLFLYLRQVNAWPEKCFASFSFFILLQNNWKNRHLHYVNRLYRISASILVYFTVFYCIRHVL